MKTITIKGESTNSNIFIGESIKNFRKYAEGSNIVVITDTNVKSHYFEYFKDSPIIKIGTGEHIKNLETVNSIIDKLILLEADRSTFIVGIGGGVVCDIAGFVASIFMRGVRFGFVATTLLAQVDASVGGKNGVNFSSYKNIVGVFNQPEFVICDPLMLKTLPKRELCNGFAEIIKHTLIADQEMFEKLEENCTAAMKLDKEFMEEIIAHSIQTKADIVNKDEFEHGERRKLNFGHTYGHAIERVSGIAHGKAVSIGMVVAAKISRAKNYISDEDVDRIISLIESFELPVYTRINKVEVFNNLKKDKKKEMDSIYYVFLKQIGEAAVEKTTLRAMEEFLHDMR